MRSHVKLLYSYHVEQRKKKYKAVEYSIQYIKDNVTAVRHTIRNTIIPKLRNTLIHSNLILGVKTNADVEVIMTQLSVYEVNENDIAFIRGLLGGLVKQNNKLSNLRTKLKGMTKEPLPYKVFNFIILSYNKAVGRLILDGYKHFQFSYNLGAIKIIELDTTDIKRKPNWGASLRKRQEIIDRGGKPYYKDKCPDGEKWLIKWDTTLEYFWHWRPIGIKGWSLYRFKPSYFYPKRDGIFITSMQEIIDKFDISELDNLSMGNVQRMHMTMAMNANHAVKYKAAYDI